ncbi:MAG: alpha/beta fold hydrolase, partial [Acidobacteriota bacterium]
PPPPSAAHLVPLQTGGAHPPLFLIHPAGGNVYCFRALAGLVGDERSLLAFRARGLKDDEAPLETIEDLAAFYLEAIRHRQPSGPYLLGGSSMGGMVAWEIAHRLRAAGETVALVALFDTYGPGHLPPAPEGPPPAMPGVDLHGPRPADERALLRVRHVLGVNARAMHAYRPPALDAPAVFLRASERRENEPDHPERAWIDLAEDGLAVHVVPGGHTGMFEPPHVERLARQLRRSLRLALDDLDD